MGSYVVVGASGATGKLLVKQLLKQGNTVKAIVRSTQGLAAFIGVHEQLELIEADVTEMDVDFFASHLEDCDAVLSCLGHNLTFKGLFGKPRRLVTDTIKKVTQAAESLPSKRSLKIILMNTTGNANRGIAEKPPLSQRMVVFILRYILPPHADNEQAADFLLLHLGHGHAFIEWCALRPDSLVDEDEISPYELKESPTRNAIFNAGRSSRINVAHAMAALASDEILWQKWKGKMPVLYNTSAS